MCGLLDRRLTLRGQINKSDIAIKTKTEEQDPFQLLKNSN